jgi:hypothetical protein
VPVRSQVFIFESDPRVFVASTGSFGPYVPACSPDSAPPLCPPGPIRRAWTPPVRACGQLQIKLTLLVRIPWPRGSGIRGIGFIDPMQSERLGVSTQHEGLAVWRLVRLIVEPQQDTALPGPWQDACTRLLCRHSKPDVHPSFA